MCAQCGHVWLSAETTQAIDEIVRTPSAARTSPGSSRLGFRRPSRQHRPNRERRNRRRRGESWQFRRSTASTIAANAGRPVNDSRGCTHFASKSVSRESLPHGQHREDGARTVDHCPRLPDTNNHPGIQSATAHLMWLPMGFAIGTRSNVGQPCERSVPNSAPTGRRVSFRFGEAAPSQRGGIVRAGRAASNDEVVSHGGRRYNQCGSPRLRLRLTRAGFVQVSINRTTSRTWPS